MTVRFNSDERCCGTCAWFRSAGLPYGHCLHPLNAKKSDAGSGYSRSDVIAPCSVLVNKVCSEHRFDRPVIEEAFPIKASATQRLYFRTEYERDEE